MERRPASPSELQAVIDQQRRILVERREKLLAAEREIRRLRVILTNQQELIEALRGQRMAWPEKA